MNETVFGLTAEEIDRLLAEDEDEDRALFDEFFWVTFPPEKE